MTRISSSLSLATHQFFHQEGFLHIHTPIITSSDCEGAGEMFRISTTSPQSSSQLTSQLIEKKTQEKDNKFEFFGKPTFLTVSGQV